jgi:hypothetical protein
MITVVCDTPNEAEDANDALLEALGGTTDFTVLAGGRILFRRADGISA